MENIDKINLEQLNLYLKEYGIDGNLLSDKQKLKALKTILFDIKVEQDLEELRYSTNNISVNEYLSRVQNLDIDETSTRRYISVVSNMQKRKKQQKRKKFLTRAFKIEQKS